MAGEFYDIIRKHGDSRARCKIGKRRKFMYDSVKASGKEPFNLETKLERFYRPEKMRTALFKMEQFYIMWQDTTVDERHRRAAKALYEHYRRLAMCILAKEFNPEMEVERVLTPSFIDTMFTDSNPYLGG